MPFVPVPGTLLVEPVFLIDSQICENTIYYTFGAVPTLADITAQTDRVNAYIQTALLPFLSNVVQLLRVVGTMIDVADGLFYVSTVDLPAAGGFGGDVINNNVACCIQFKTAQHGRSFHGRNYIAGMPRDAFIKSEIAPANVTQLNDYAGGLMAVGSAEGWAQTVVSRFSGVDPVTHKPIPRLVGVPTIVTSAFLTDNVADSQRRRLPGRGS